MSLGRTADGGAAWRRGPLSVCLAAVACWALLLAVSRLLLLRYGLDPWMFTFVQLASGGLFLIAVPGRSPAGLAALRRPDTWVVGCLRVATGALVMAALIHVNVMQAGFIGAINLPLAAVAVRVAFGRRVTRREWLAHAVLIAGAALLAAGLEGGLGNAALPLLLLSEVAVVGSALLAERHPHNRAEDLATRLRLTGIVLLVTAAGFAAWRGAQVALGLAVVADFAALANPTLWIAGILVGISLRGPSTYLTFRAVQLAGTQNYLAAVLLLPLLGLAFEAAVAAGGGGAWPRPTGFDLAGGALVLAGGFGIVLARRR